MNDKINWYVLKAQRPGDAEQVTQILASAIASALHQYPMLFTEVDETGNRKHVFVKPDLATFECRIHPREDRQFHAEVSLVIDESKEPILEAVEQET